MGPGREVRHGQRALLPGAFSTKARDARRAPHRGPGPGGGRGGAGPAGEPGEAGLPGPGEGRPV